MKKTDWRKLPRKPAAAKRSVKVGIKLTATEAEQLRAAAREAGMTLSDYLARR